MLKTLKFQYSATISLMAICIGMFVLTMLLDLLTGGDLNNANILLFLGAENITLILNGEVWRVVLPAFLHADLIHLTMNMYGLWYLGRFVEMYYGGKNLFSIFILTSICGSLLSILAGFLGVILGLTDSGSIMATVSVGASGGLFGLMGLLLSDKLHRDHLSPELPVDQNSLIIMIFINIFYGFMVPGINIWAHLGGLIGGVGLGFFIKTKHIYNRNKYTDVIQNVLFIFTLVMVILSYLAHIISIF